MNQCPACDDLRAKIASKEAKIAVIGLGYVGLPLVVEIAGAGFNVTGVDINSERVGQLAAGETYIDDVDGRILKDLVEKGRIRASDKYDTLAEADVGILCVPTPLTKHKEPDISYIITATGEIAKRLHKGMLLVLESTTYPGTTEEVILPLLEETGFKVGDDFFLAFSPERVDPGNRTWQIANTPKIMGGYTANCKELAVALYSQFIQKVIPVGSPRVAETIKLLENTFRAVNIALVNEVAIICDKLGIDTWEVIDGAATKPFGFMPFYPGPGLGGHCIPIDPLYLSWKLRSLNYHARFIELAGEINSAMPRFVVEKVSDALNDHSRAIKGSRILVLGISYKKDVSDVRESPALEVIHLLINKGAVIAYHDPYATQYSDDDIDLESVPLNSEVLNNCHCVVILTDHSNIDYQWLVQESPLIVDTRNATRGIVSDKVRKI